MVQRSPSSNEMLRGPLHFLSCVICYDLWFYIVHRLLHLPRFYARYHSQHHQHTHPSYKESFSASTEENVVGFLGILIPLAFTSEICVPSFAAAYIYCFVRGILRHDSRASWLVGDHHLRHHIQPSCNYSSYYVDYMFGTLADLACPVRPAKPLKA